MNEPRKLKNPLQNIYDWTTKKSMQERMDALPEFPRMIDVELTNECNYKCVMCPIGQGLVKRKKGFMSSSILNCILDEAAKYGSVIRFIRWGEPTMSKRLLEAIVGCRQRGLVSHINTNGSLLTAAKAKLLVESGLNSIKFSFQGANAQGYALIRNANNYHNLLKIIEIMRDHRERLRLDTPFIQIGTTISNEDEALVNEFKHRTSPICDAVYIGYTRDLQEVNPSNSRFCQCPEVFDKMSVDWDGTVTACCGDYDQHMKIGVMRRSAHGSLKELWDGPELAKIREDLLNYRHDNYYLCKRCARTDHEM